MKKTSFLERLRDWDADRFDLTEKTAGDMHPDLSPKPLKQEIPDAPLERLMARGERAFDRLYPVLALVLGTVMIVFLFLTVLDLPPYGTADSPVFNEVAVRYLADGMAETGAANAVAGVILDYRAFDTLGESHVLYAAMTAVLILLLSEKGEADADDPGARMMERDPLLTVTASVITPIVILFGVYNMLTGHLGPGGGFSGGAIVGAGMILLSAAFGPRRMERIVTFRTFRIACASALCFYSVSKLYSFFCGANGLHTIFSPGTPGRILSAGLILPLNIAVGVVVSFTMYGLYSLFERGRIG
jgi:multicomponent Na+:H+ antiporter subunit B